MKRATLGGIIPGNYRGVGYEAKATVSVMGGFTAGYRFDMKADWTWGDGSFESIEAALDAASRLAREAISNGRHEALRDAP
ncbi:hypothetical protein D3C71_1000040 [compost metagenome]